MPKLSGLIVILGSPNDELGNLSEMGLGRIELGYQEYLKHTKDNWKILLTGGFGGHFNRTDKPNAYYAQKQLLAKGVKADDIIDFALSRNTVDDALQARKVIETYEKPKLLIISSDFHMQRVEYIFRAVFPEYALEFKGANYLNLRPEVERAELLAHEQRELNSLKQKGESIVGGNLNIHSWR